MKKQPNFFIVGAPKAGTTSLYHYLRQHPEIYMSPLKEPNYFASEIRPENFGAEFQEWVQRETRELREYLCRPVLEQRFGGIVADWKDYLKLFEAVTAEKAIGEASVCYLWSRTAARNIFSAVPGAKLLMILRNPADRAFSQYLHAVTNGWVRESFRARIDVALGRGREPFGILNPFLEFGLYYEQVKRYLEFFPAANLRIYLFEDYQKQPGSVLADIFCFLDVDPSFEPNISQRHLEPRIPRSVKLAYWLKRYGIWEGVRKISPPAVRSAFRTVAFRKRESVLMDAEARKLLTVYYQDDVRQLSDLLCRDLNAWLS